MSFKGLNFIRQWTKVNIYKPRVRGLPQPTAPALAETCREDATSAKIEIQEVEEEIGGLEKGMEKLLEGSPLSTPK